MVELRISVSARSGQSQSMRIQHARCSSCPTRQHCLAQDLAPDALARLSACLAPPVILQRGEFLYRMGDASDALHIVRSGAIKTLTIANTGEEHVTALHFSGELFGMMGLTRGVHEDSAMALDVSTVCHVHRQDLPELWETGCDRAFLKLVDDREAEAIRHHVRFSSTGAATRLASFLLYRSRRQVTMGLTAEDIYLPVSRTDLANHLGMTLESLSRVVSRMIKSGIVEAEKDRLVICKMAELTLIGEG